MYKFFKRLADVIMALAILIIASPILLLIAIAIKIDSKGPILFKQVRLGRGAKEFYIYKFRTMIVGAEAGGVYSDNTDSRVTRVGRFLRKTSLDELPQVINILVGQMSFIGPRPPLTYHPWTVDKYTDEQRRMFDVRPGITGWAPVNGRRTVEWNKRIELNVWYVDNISFALDFKIFFMTIFKVLRNSDNENVGASVVTDPVAEDKEAVTSSSEKE